MSMHVDERESTTLQWKTKKVVGIRCDATFMRSEFHLSCVENLLSSSVHDSLAFISASYKTIYLLVLSLRCPFA